MNWISTNERLPEKFTRVITSDEGGWIQILELDDEHKWRCDEGWTIGVTHWMPLPKKPKK